MCTNNMQNNYNILHADAHSTPINTINTSTHADVFYKKDSATQLKSKFDLVFCMPVLIWNVVIHDLRTMWMNAMQCVQNQ